MGCPSNHTCLLPSTLDTVSYKNNFMKLVGFFYPRLKQFPLHHNESDLKKKKLEKVKQKHSTQSPLVSFFEAFNCISQLASADGSCSALSKLPPLRKMQLKAPKKGKKVGLEFSFFFWLNYCFYSQEQIFTDNHLFKMLFI